MDNAQALAFLEALPQGLSTPLGEKGITLSGEQKQRRAIGRHEELIRQDDLYARLAALQFGEMRENMDSPAQP